MTGYRARVDYTPAGCRIEISRIEATLAFDRALDPDAAAEAVRLWLGQHGIVDSCTVEFADADDIPAVAP